MDSVAQMTDPGPPDLTNAQLRTLLARLRACVDGRRAVGRDSARTAWGACRDGSRLLWVAGRLDIDRRLLVRAAAACAETALPYVPEGEDRPRLAIEAARAWADDPSEENAARCREAAAAYAVAYAAAADAAYAAAADAAYAAADAAYAAADAVADAVDAHPAQARAQARRRCADLVREHVPVDVVLAAAGRYLGEADHA